MVNILNKKIRTRLQSDGERQQKLLPGDLEAAQAENTNL